MIWTAVMAAELTIIAQTAVSYLFLCFCPYMWTWKCLRLEKLVFQEKQARPWRFRDRRSDWKIIYGVRNWSFDTTRCRRVVGVEATSLPSPSLSMAESSTNRYFLLLGSTTEMSVLESDEKKRKRVKKNSLAFVVKPGKKIVRSERKLKTTQTGRAAKKM